MRRYVFMSLVLLVAASFQSVQANERPHATYLANAGVMVTDGDTKILFDPLYRLPHAFYLALPEAMENQLLAGEPPYDGVDVVLVTHFHLDHFSPNLLLSFLMLNAEARLVAPEQAVVAMRRYTSKEDEGLMERVVSLNLSQYGQPTRHVLGNVVVETVRVPHSGWPDRNRGVQNLVYRVTLNNSTVVTHLGDAHSDPESFRRFSDHWEQGKPDMLFTPYWFYLEREGRNIMSQLLAPRESVGVHVPADVPAAPAQRSKELQDLNLFIRPGEIRAIGGSGSR